VGLSDKPLPMVGKDSPGLFGAGTPAFLTSKIDFLVNWGRRNSLWPMPLGTACCGIEMMASFASDFDMARFGMERMSFSPGRPTSLSVLGG
jgi:NADH-quinone oxidoreductase subunit B